MAGGAIESGSRHTPRETRFCAGLCVVAAVVGAPAYFAPAGLMSLYEMDRAWPLALYTHPATLTLVGVGAGGLLLAAAMLGSGTIRGVDVSRAGLVLAAIFGCGSGAVAAVGALAFQFTSDSYIPGIGLGYRLGGSLLVARFLPLAAGAASAGVLFRRRCFPTPDEAARRG